MEEIYSLPASEIEGWKEYFDIYPFTQDREDARVALLTSTILNSSGRYKKIAKITDFLPNYFEVKKTGKSLEQQKLEALAWASKYKRGN